MEYIRVKWLHLHQDEPVLLYSELDKNRWETRKVEVFADGRVGFASATEATPSTKTKLSLEPLPTLEEIASDPQFQPAVITKDEFEVVWSNRESSGAKQGSYLFSGSGVEKTSVFSLTRAISGPDDNKGIISRSSTIGY